MKTVAMKSSCLPGRTGTLARNIIKNWLLGLRQTNPAILDMYADRDKKPYRDLLPWSGEFSGKYITGAYYIYRMTLDQTLFDEIQTFIGELISLQADDGYLGCYSENCRLTGTRPQTPDEIGGTWDAWNHYHNMYGLLMWYRETGKEEYLACVERAAQLFIRKFYNPETGNKHLVEIGWSEMNLAPVHVFAMLYNLTGKRAYLDFALHIIDDLPDERAGDYIRYAEEGEFYQCPKPRWESMHIILGIAELYRATGEERFKNAAVRTFRSILKTDVHNTGAFSTNEQAVGNPFSEGAIETCCVIAYDALGVEVYKLTGDPAIIDFLECAHYNACMGFWSPTGRWSTYDTPMNGEKKANFHSINFQCRPGSPELNCCSVNAARGIGMMTDWAVTKSGDTLYINAYEAAEYVTDEGVSITVEGAYPVRGEVTLRVSGYTGRVALRVPAWSQNTTVAGGTGCRKADPGYWVTDCAGEIALTLNLDFTTRFSEGDLACAGLTSVYRGPLLFGTDLHLVTGHDLDALPLLDRDVIASAPSVCEGEAVRIDAGNGVVLTDFYHLGTSGAAYATWLKLN